MVSHIVLIVRPQELDEAARRRFVKRLYVPLPEREGRKQLIGRLLAQQPNSLTITDLDVLGEKTEGIVKMFIENFTIT